MSCKCGITKCKSKACFRKWLLSSFRKLRAHSICSFGSSRTAGTENNTDSFVHSIAPFEEDWHLSQGQQEALLAVVALVVNGSVDVADEAVVGIDIVLASPAFSEAATVHKHHPLKSQCACFSSSGSQSRFSFWFSVPTVVAHPQFQF